MQQYTKPNIMSGLFQAVTLDHTEEMS